jgi:hypothetical protein
MANSPADSRAIKKPPASADGSGNSRRLNVLPPERFPSRRVQINSATPEFIEKFPLFWRCAAEIILWIWFHDYASGAEFSLFLAVTCGGGFHSFRIP